MYSIACCIANAFVAMFNASFVRILCAIFFESRCWMR
jgi:hypothetical protein